jgi:hypothetical protein
MSTTAKMAALGSGKPHWEAGPWSAVSNKRRKLDRNPLSWWGLKTFGEGNVRKFALISKKCRRQPGRCRNKTIWPLRKQQLNVKRESVYGKGE